MPPPTRWHEVPAAARFAIHVAALAALSLSPARALEPRVPYVPTPQDVVERMLEIAKVGPHDYLIDLGSGDGRIVVTAAKKYGTRGFGVDLNPERIRESTENARRAGVSEKIAFYQRDLFETNLADATVITMYLLPQVNIELRPKLLELRPGTRLVSHDFDMGDWKPDTHIKMEAQDKYGGAGGQSDIYFWIVPARVAGVWRWELPVSGNPLAYEVTLEQRYQVITGSVAVGGRAVKLQNARLRADAIRFAFTAEVNGAPVKHEFTGRVAGEAVTGSARLSGARLQGQHDWNARRAQSSSTDQREVAPRFAQSSRAASR
ncbi:MAG: SAM-dependent methyltransferase [Burkholderiales bacterium]